MNIVFKQCVYKMPCNVRIHKIPHSCVKCPTMFAFITNFITVDEDLHTIPELYWVSTLYQSDLGMRQHLLKSWVTVPQNCPETLPPSSLPPPRPSTIPHTPLPTHPPSARGNNSQPIR